MDQTSDSSPPFGEDQTDRRDRYYTPSLRPLASDSVQGFLGRIGKEGMLPYTIRQQGDSGTCAGQALANLIDLHRIGSAGAGAPRPAPVSARMLYRMGVQQEQGLSPSGAEGVQSLRSVIKGFYHNGACPDMLWPDDDGETETGLTPERAKAARQTTLGAYYRVRSYLNDYHAALSEADCILASAEIHSGWAEPAGVIPVEPGSAGAHAFVIVGYNDRGFLVLNSHGEAWGGYSERGHVLGGVALWTYEDWADRVMDAWVLRLGVPAPAAFQYSNTRRGIFFDEAPVAVRSTPSHQLLGHFAHLDDGKHVAVGSYASSRGSVETTAAMIAARPERPVLLSLPGSLLGIDDAFRVEAERRPGIETALEMYPYTLFWCNDMVESTTAVLEHLFGTAVEKVGPHSAALNRAIESATSGIGRAFWRDIKRAAGLAGQHRHLRARRWREDLDVGERKLDGGAAAILDGFAATGARLHLVADGAGALLLEQYLLSLASKGGGTAMRGRRDTFFDAVSSLTLIAPTIEAEPFETAFAPLIAALHDKGPHRATLWSPSYGFERKLAVGHYARSILHLVLYGFEGADETRSYVGMSVKRSGIDARTEPGKPLEGLQLRKIKTPDHRVSPRDKRRRRYRQAHVVQNEACQAAIRDDLARIKSEDEAKGTEA